MAGIDSCFNAFDTLMQAEVKNLGLDGGVTKHTDYLRARILILYRFVCRYLTICDMVDYDWHDLNKNTVLMATFRHLRDIEYQFRFYFEGIWG